MLRTLSRRSVHLVAAVALAAALPVAGASAALSAAAPETQVTAGGGDGYIWD